MLRVARLFLHTFLFLLGGALVALWVHSYFHSASLQRISERRTFGVWNYKGTLGFWTNRYGRPEGGKTMWKYATRPIPELQFSEAEWFPRVSLFNKAGFYYRDLRYFPPGRVDLAADRTWMAPFWSLILIVWLVPALSLSRILRSRHRHAPGVCAHCGYDLRASPERCPECGAAPVRP